MMAFMKDIRHSLCLWIRLKLAVVFVTSVGLMVKV